MTHTSNLTVAELDFDLIKQELITYFKSDPTFQDYDFEGSALNILVDILSYNTHMNAVQANMMANEMFIDSAQLRQSIVSIAKSLSYTPRSKRTALAVIDLSFSGVSGVPAYLSMPAGTRFTTPQGYVFSTKEQLLIYPKTSGFDGVYEITDVEIHEGLVNTFNYTVNYNNPDQRFIIPSVNADISTLVVKNIVGTTQTTFTLNENLTLLDASSKKYFLHENPDGTFEVSFGDNILGYRPVNNSTVSLSYVISKHGEDANNVGTFQKYQSIDGESNYTITTKVVAYGAADAQTQESIAFTAPKMYKAQSRAVVTQDYENFMLTEYPFIESMSIWGGEYNDPPVYGKVFMAIKPSHTDFLSDNLKAKIKSELISKFNVVTVIPEIVDPDYVYVLVNSQVQYDYDATTLSENELIIEIRDNIELYFADNTETFNKPFYFSALVKYIDTSDDALVNSLTEIEMMKKFYPLVGATERRELKFSNAIVPGTVKSSAWNISGTVGTTAKQTLKDDGEGNIYTISELTGEIIDPSVGAVDYSTGTMDFIITPFDVPADTLDIRIYATPAVKNILPGYNQIILLDTSAERQDFGRDQGISISITAENSDYK